MFAKCRQTTEWSDRRKGRSATWIRGASSPCRVPAIRPRPPSSRARLLRWQPSWVRGLARADVDIDAPKTRSAPRSADVSSTRRPAESPTAHATTISTCTLSYDSQCDQPQIISIEKIVSSNLVIEYSSSDLYGARFTRFRFEAEKEKFWFFFLSVVWICFQKNGLRIPA